MPGASPWPASPSRRWAPPTSRRSRQSGCSLGSCRVTRCSPRRPSWRRRPATRAPACAGQRSTSATWSRSTSNAASSEPDSSPRHRGGVVEITVTVNGLEHRADVEPRMLLTDFLRTELGLTGTHVGCDTTSCGVCAVLLDNRPVKSCTVFAVQADGRSITTVEGLRHNGTLHPIQQGFKEEHGLQCGFCTPAMMLVGASLIEHNADPSDDEIRWALSGNLCRCTGYMNIVKSIQWAAHHQEVAE